METTLDRRRFGWVWLVYPILWGPLRLLYVAANRAYGTEAPEGNLSFIWWLLVLLWFMADVLLVLGLAFLRRKVTVDQTPPKPFWYEISEIVPVWLLLHLSLLFFEYPVAARLQSVGLGKLEVIMFVAAIIAGASYALRSSKMGGGRTVGQVRKGGVANTVFFFAACLLLFCIPIAIPYFATRPLPRDALIHMSGRTVTPETTTSPSAWTPRTTLRNGGFYKR